MNLIENEEQTTRSKKAKTIMAVIIVLIVILILLCVGVIYIMMDLQKNTLKLNVDGKSKKFASDVFIFEDNEMYISIKDFAKLVGYEAYNGDHRSETITKCYIKNSDEEASFELNSNKIYKNLLEETDNEYFNIEEPVKMIKDKLYTKTDGMQIAANCLISYSQEKMQITVYTLPYLVTSYMARFQNSVLVDEDANYNNKKALLYDMVVVMNEDEKYGVHTTANKEIIGTKYTNIEFIESSQDFIVTTDENKMGIISADGTTKILPEYDEIKQIDKDLKLYLVTNNKKQGVINQNGNIIIHLEYDKIGIDTAKFISNGIRNQHLLFDSCIPVQRDNKWGVFDKTGKQVIKVEYDELGCIAGTQSSKSNNNLLIIPKYEGIVVRLEKKYGIISSVGRELVPCVLDSVYSVTSAGEDIFYMMQGDKTLDVIDYIEKFVLKDELEVKDINDTENETTNEIAEGQNTEDQTNEIAEQNNTQQEPTKEVNETTQETSTEPETTANVTQ